MDALFSGKKALIVGGTSGIGLSIARELEREGALVSIVGRTAVSGMDVSLLDLNLSQNCVKVLEMAGVCDILVVARGPFMQATLDETTPEAWESLVFSNLVFPGQLVSAALPSMRSNHWGRILLFGGTRTDRIRGFRTNAAYAAAKTGLSSLVLSVAEEYAKEGITCNALCPGFVDSPLLDSTERIRLQQKSPGATLISVREVTETALFLIKSAAINGTVLRIDRGWAPSFV